MSESAVGAPSKAISYAKIVNPNAVDNTVAAPVVPDVEVAVEAVADEGGLEDDGFQEVTNKKSEKVKERPPRKKRSRGGKNRNRADKESSPKDALDKKDPAPTG